MGVIGAPHQGVHADQVPHSQAHGILLETQVNVAVEVIAGKQVAFEPVGRFFVAFVVGVVHGSQQVGHPGQLELDDGHLEFGVALKHAGENHVADGGGRPEDLVGPAAGVPDAGTAGPPASAFPPGCGVQTQWHVEVLGGSPERLVLGAVVPAVLGGVLGYHAAGQPQLGRPLQLLDSFPNVVQVYHGHALEPVRVGIAELGEPVIVGPEYRGHQLRVGDLEVEKALGRIKHLAGNPVQLHVADVLVRVVSAGVDVFKPAVGRDGLWSVKPGAGVGDEAYAGDHLVSFNDQMVDVADPLHVGRPVLEPGVDSLCPQVRGLENMGVGGNYNVVVHGASVLSKLSVPGARSGLFYTSATPGRVEAPSSRNLRGERIILTCVWLTYGHMKTNIVVKTGEG